MKTRLILALLLGIDALILYTQFLDLSISFYETNVLYHETSLLHYIITASLTLFGQNDFALRLPMVLMHLTSAMLLFQISKHYLKYDKDRFWLVVIYMLLPGVNSAALVVDAAGLVILSLFFYMYIFYYQKKYEYFILPLFLFVDQSIAFLYLGLIFFEHANGSYKKVAVLMVLLIMTFVLHPLETSVELSGHFLDTLGLYAAIFSPIVFVYLFYILYRAYINHKRDVSWYISFTALVISLLLSFRQRIEIEVFAPYLMIALPLAAQAFFSSYRVRLREFRRRYRQLFLISFLLLLFNTLLILNNKELYVYIDIPKKHFAYKMHVAKELAAQLQEMGVDCISANDTMQPRLFFYGINQCSEYQLVEGFHENNVTISYKSKVVYEAYVTKSSN